MGCEPYGVVPVSLSVDPAGRLAVEADALYILHWVRLTEGYRVLCGRRAPSLSPWSGSGIGSSEGCFFWAVVGEAHAAAGVTALPWSSNDKENLKGTSAVPSLRKYSGETSYLPVGRRAHL